MDFHEYLDFADPDGLKLKGHRIWLHDLVYEVVFNHATAEDLSRKFKTLTMAEIYASLLYLEQNHEACMKALADHLDWSRANFDAAGESSRNWEGELRRRKAERIQRTAR